MVVDPRWADWERFFASGAPFNFVEVTRDANGLLEDIQPLYHDRAAVRQLAKEVEAATKEYEGWKAGVALLAVLEAESGNYEGAARHLSQVLADSKKHVIPSRAAWMFGAVLEGKNERIDQLVISLYEHSISHLPRRDLLRRSAITNLVRSSALASS